MVRKKGILPYFSEILSGNYLKMALIPQNIRRNASLPTITGSRMTVIKPEEKLYNNKRWTKFEVRSKEKTVKEV